MTVPPACCGTVRSSRRRRKSASPGRRRTPRFPRQAVATAFARAGIGVDDLEYVGFYDKPLLKFERILETYLGFAPRGFKLVPDGGAALDEGEALPRPAAPRTSSAVYDGRRCSSPSTTSRTRRARSSPRRSTRPRSSPSTAWASGPPPRSGIGEGNDIRIAERAALPDSLGLLYSAFTYYTRLQGQLGRVQGDGPRALRRAQVRAT